MCPLLLSILLLVVCDLIAGDISHWLHKQRDAEPFCRPFNYTCGLIAPAPPTSYEAHIEHVDLARDTTHYLEEFYDYEDNMLAMTDSSGNTFLHIIFYYDINTAVIMTKKQGLPEGPQPMTCNVAEIPQDSIYHPLPGVNGSVHHVLAPSQALLFGNDFRYKYVENETVRGMECNRWDACISAGKKDSFYVKYFWTDPAMTLDRFGYPRERPVQMLVTGRIQPIREDTTRGIEIDSMYSVALFDDKPDLNRIRWAFEIPEGVYCEGFPSEKKPPSSLAEAYSMRVEVTYWATERSVQEYVGTVRNWYDFYHKLTRADTIATPGTLEFAVAGPVQVATIKDFYLGVEYIINKDLGNCSTLMIEGEGYDTITTPGGQFIIKDPMAIFGLTETDLIYQGMKYARGLPCDVWIGHMEKDLYNNTIHESYTYELYFLQSGWFEDAGGDKKENKPVPVMISVHEQFINDFVSTVVNINIKQNIFKYEEDEPLSTVYDITPCFFGHDHIRRFQMAFDGTYRPLYDKNPTSFTVTVRDHLLIFLEIPFIRIQHVQIEYVESDDRLYCEFTLLDQPQVDMTLPPSAGDPLNKVVERLQNSMDKIVIIIVDDQMQPHMMRPIEDSLLEMYENGCYSRHSRSMSLQDLHDPPCTHQDTSPHHQAQKGTREKEERNDEAKKTSVFPFFSELQGLVRDGDDGKIYTPGDMGGMAMGMLVLGLLLGSVVMWVILKKMGLSDNPELIPMNSRR